MYVCHGRFRDSDTPTTQPRVQAASCRGGSTPRVPYGAPPRTPLAHTLRFVAGGRAGRQGAGAAGRGIADRSMRFCGGTTPLAHGRRSQHQQRAALASPLPALQHAQRRRQRRVSWPHAQQPRQHGQQLCDCRRTEPGRERPAGGRSRMCVILIASIARRAGQGAVQHAKLHCHVACARGALCSLDRCSPTHS